MVSDNGDGSFTIEDKDGNKTTWALSAADNGADRIELSSTGSTGNASTVFEGEMAGGGRASGRFVDCAGSADVMTDPETGFIAWAG